MPPPASEKRGARRNSSDTREASGGQAPENKWGMLVRSDTLPLAESTSVFGKLECIWESRSI